MRTLCRTLAIAAIALVAGTVGSQPHRASAASCFKSVTLNLITYGPPNGCWGYNRARLTALELE